MSAPAGPSLPTLHRVAFAMRIAAVVLVASTALRGALEVVFAWAFEGRANGEQMIVFVLVALLAISTVAAAFFWGASAFDRAASGDPAADAVALRRLNGLLALQVGCLALVPLGACLLVLAVALFYASFGALG